MAQIVRELHLGPRARRNTQSQSSVTAFGVPAGRVLYQNGPLIVNTGSSIDWNLGNHQELELTGDITLTMTAPPGPAMLYLLVEQKSLGGYDITWPVLTVKWPDGEPAWNAMGPTEERLIRLWYAGDANESYVATSTGIFTGI